MYCIECDHTETDPVFLDLETCSECGGLLMESDDDHEAEGLET